MTTIDEIRAWVQTDQQTFLFVGPAETPTNPTNLTNLTYKIYSFPLLLPNEIKQLLRDHLNNCAPFSPPSLKTLPSLSLTHIHTQRFSLPLCEISEWSLENNTITLSFNNNIPIRKCVLNCYKLSEITNVSHQEFVSQLITNITNAKLSKNGEHFAFA